MAFYAFKALSSKPSALALYVLIKTNVHKNEIDSNELIKKRETFTERCHFKEIIINSQKSAHRNLSKSQVKKSNLNVNL